MISIVIPDIDVSFPISDIPTNLRGKSGIYLFYSESGELMYIGKTTDLLNRLRIHFSSDKGTENIRHNFKHVECLFVADPLEMELYETYMINTLKPLLNRQKVLTYLTSYYDVEYNPRYHAMEEEKQKRLDAAMMNFHL